MPAGAPGMEICRGSLSLTSEGGFLQGSFSSSISSPPRVALPRRGLPAAHPPSPWTWLPGTAPPGLGTPRLHPLPDADIDNRPLPTDTRAASPGP